MKALARRGDGALVAIGTAVCLVGLWLWWFASPSPHRYIELVVALPTTCIGLMIIGATIASSHRPAGGFWFWLGLCTLILAALPLLGLVALLVIGTVA